MGQSALTGMSWVCIRVVTSEQPLIPATLAMLTAFGAVFLPPARLGPYVCRSAWGEVAEIVGET